MAELRYKIRFHSDRQNLALESYLQTQAFTVYDTPDAALADCRRMLEVFELAPGEQLIVQPALLGVAPSMCLNLG